MPTSYNRLVQLLAVSLLLFSSVRSLPLLNQETPSLDSLASYAARDVILEKRGDKDGGSTAIEAAPLGRLLLRNNKEDKETSEGKVRRQITAKEQAYLDKAYARKAAERAEKAKKKKNALSIAGVFAGMGGSGSSKLSVEANKKGGEFTSERPEGSKPSAFKQQKDKEMREKMRAEVAAEMAEDQRKKEIADEVARQRAAEGANGDKKNKKKKTD